MVLGNAEFYFAPDAKNLTQAEASGWQKYCSIDEVGMETETEVKEKAVKCRGLERTVKKVTRLIGLKYKLKLNELGPKQLQLLYFAEPLVNGRRLGSDNERLMRSTFMTPQMDWPAQRWLQIYDLDGTELTDLSFYGELKSTIRKNDEVLLHEGVDYAIDRKKGLIQFRNQHDDTFFLFEDWEAPPIAPNQAGFDADYMRKVRPYTKANHRGMGRLVVYDDDEINPVALRHWNFHCALTTVGGPTFGEDFATMEVEIEVLDGVMSEVVMRPDKDVFGRMTI